MCDDKCVSIAPPFWQVGLVNSWNEWDQLEEIIVGTASLAVIPPVEPAFEMKVKDSGKLELLAAGGWSMSRDNFLLCSVQRMRFLGIHTITMPS